MAATAYYQNRERAFMRTNRIHRDINRASAYILDTDSVPVSSSSYLRSSSLTRDAPRYVDPSNTGYRFKDRFSGGQTTTATKSIPIRSTKSPVSSPISNLPPSPRPGAGSKTYPKDFNPYSETARYKREQEMKDIHEEFMKNWSSQNSKLNGNEEKKTKAYHKIMGTAVSAIEERDFTRQTLGDIFKDMDKFSTKTVAALNTLESQGSNKSNKNYNWRKEIEKYETTGQLERDARIRNIEIRNKRSSNIDPSSVISRRNESSAQSRRSVQPPVVLGPSPLKPLKKNSNITRISQEAKVEPPQIIENKLPSCVIEPSDNIMDEVIVPEKMTDVAKDKKPEESEEPESNSPSTISKKRTKTIKRKVLSKKAEEPNSTSEQKVIKEEPSTEDIDVEQSPSEIKKPEDEEEEDVHGTKKMKDDFTSRMTSLDAEMTAGRSNLARIRERIRKAKQGLMAIEI